jgi:hypothetical protein
VVVPQDSRWARAGLAKAYGNGRSGHASSRGPKERVLGGRAARFPMDASGFGESAWERSLGPCVFARTEGAILGGRAAMV